MDTEDYIRIDRGRCLDCAACVGICPPSALIMEGLRLVFSQETCVECDDCVLFCPAAALAAAGGPVR